MMDAEDRPEQVQPENENAGFADAQSGAGGFLISPDQAAASAPLAEQAPDVPAAGEGSRARPPDSKESGLPDRTHVRERIVRRFETWLDDVLEGEGPIEGLAAEILEQLEAEPAACDSRAVETGCDLYSLWSAVTAMAEETRLQGRAFKQLHQSLTPMQGLVESVADVLQRYMTSLEQQDQRLSESTRQAVLQEVLGTLIDVRDRLVRGTETANIWLVQARTPPKLSLGQRLRQKIAVAEPRLRQEHEEAVLSLLKGYGLAQEVLDDALARLGVRPMDAVGRPFDPGAMKAVDLDDRSDAADGTVLEVYRQGYWWNNAVYRPAEVKVARKKEV